MKQLFRFVSAALLAVVGFVVTSCASGASQGANNPVFVADEPPFILAAQSRRNIEFVGTGYGDGASRSSSLRISANSTRQNIAADMSSVMQGMINSYSRESEAQGVAIDVLETVSQTLIHASFQGVQTERQSMQVGDRYRSWTAMTLPKSEGFKAIENLIQEEAKKRRLDIDMQEMLGGLERMEEAFNNRLNN